MGSFVLVSQIFQTTDKKSKTFVILGWLALFLLVFLAGLNLKIYLDQFKTNNQHKNLYLNFGEQVRKVIPSQKTIYLSTTPDLYFELQGRNRLYEFPSISPKIKEYIDLLNDSDYLVINFHLERMFVGNLLDKYIELNKLKEFSAGEFGIYQAKIIELKPKKERLSP